MRKKSNLQQSASHPPLPTVEPNTQEEESKSQQITIIEAQVREALYPLNPRYKVVTASKSDKKV